MHWSLVSRSQPAENNVFYQDFKLRRKYTAVFDARSENEDCFGLPEFKSEMAGRISHCIFLAGLPGKYLNNTLIVGVKLTRMQKYKLVLESNRHCEVLSIWNELGNCPKLNIGIYIPFFMRPYKSGEHNFCLMQKQQEEVKLSLEMAEIRHIPTDFSSVKVHKSHWRKPYNKFLFVLLHRWLFICSFGCESLAQTRKVLSLFVATNKTKENLCCLWK